MRRVAYTVIIIGFYFAMFQVTGDPKIAVVCVLAAVVEACFVCLCISAALVIILCVCEAIDHYYCRCHER